MKQRTWLITSLIAFGWSAWLVPALCAGEPFPAVQVHFAGPAKMRVHWQVPGGKFCSQPLVVPANLNFRAGAVYRLKITHIPGYEGVELYPSLEIAPVTPRSTAFLAHSKIPIELTAENFAQVIGGRFVRKVIYLPGVNGPAAAPGPILAIFAIGNKDLEPSP